MVRIEVETGRLLEIVPTTPYALAQFIDPVYGSISRGSLLRISNTAGSRLGSYMLPGGPAAEASFGKQTWPVITSNAESTLVQIPWEAPVDADPAYLQLKLKTTVEAGPFEPAWIIPRVLKLRAASPTWFVSRSSATTFSLLAAHEDFSSLTSSTSPARASEIIHVYGTGFGEVTPPTATGQPAGSNPLSRVSANVECSLGQVEEGLCLWKRCSPGWLRG